MSSPHEVLLLVFPGFQLLDVSGPAEVFAAANDLQGRPLYRLRLISLEGGLVASSSGLAMHTEPMPVAEMLEGCTLLVSGGLGVHQAMGRGLLAAWLKRVAPCMARCGSVCTGAFLLAQAGLLDGRRAATHWRYAELLQRLFPRVQVEADALFVEEDRLFSSAGVSSGIDLCLALLEADHGRELALQVAKGLVVHLRRSGGQRQFSAELLAQAAAPGGVVEGLVTWLREHLHEALDVERMAAALSLSPRSLHRHCQAELGQTPARLLLQLRLERACRLLENGAPSLKRVAQQTGFASEYNLRRAFLQSLGIAPSDYRARFSRGDGRGRSRSGPGSRGPRPAAGPSR
ncbi:MULTISPECIES: helix-turn-helix domain-containing protein [unclassified Pseudomonas]|uniref:GlxA family transcriptional regulator n=1 Tax=unclassified Pseudomonas TaxID=196821 RepID=UPI00244B9B65|nr:MULTISPECIES: helix-turn-helix domain-containing protein [unclassified Pseudomonas]MDG9927646.1 helix-turn-helix domain-containing protein [Pseudomonas sp. GD04042]MDH0484002.1 helix-turn-helix domain-containing protein [Pseudomonas sp. GD04015]MDH0603878.1 helix-turn-helix domain-containing protein [Pseudomonas sp. GD03869]